MKTSLHHAVFPAALALLLAAALPAPAQAQTSPRAPDAVELEFWKAATLINNPDSYGAYLSRYPQGAFAELARAGAGKAAPAPPPVGPARLQLDVAALKRQPKHTGAVEFAPGAVFVGPGFVTVGHWGAKRQLVVPAGHWVVVAATDHSLIGQYEIQLTTVGLLRTDTEAAGTTLFATFNRRGMPSVFGSLAAAFPRWDALDSCFSRSVVSLVQVPSSDMRVQWCTAYRMESAVPKFAQMAAAFQQDWAAALKAANATLPDHQVSLESHVQDKQGHFTSYLLRQRAGLGTRLLSSKSPEPYDTVPATLDATQLSEVRQGMHLTLTAARAHQRVYERFEILPDGPRANVEALDRVLVDIE